jgi:hypothetical protein
MAVSNPSGLTINNPQTGIQYTKVTDSSADWASVANSTYFYDISSALVYYKNSAGTVVNSYAPVSTNDYGTLTAFTNFNFLT